MAAANNNNPLPQGVDKEMIFAIASIEMEHRVESFNKFSQTCFSKCADKRYKESELNMQETSCIDRCVAKYWQVNNIIGKMVNVGGGARPMIPGWLFMPFYHFVDDVCLETEKDKDQADNIETEWLKLLNRIWALGPRHVGPNMLFAPDFNKKDPDHMVMVRGSTHVSERLGFIDSSSNDIVPAEKDEALYAVAERLESSVFSGFQLATAASPLCDEPMWGLGFVVEAYLSPSADVSESIQQEEQYGILTGQVMSAVKDACRAAVLQKKPWLVEGMYFCELNTPTECLGSIYDVLARRRGRILKEEMQDSSPLFTVHAYIPVSEIHADSEVADSLSFPEEVRRWTCGAASALLSYPYLLTLPAT
ncbi:hypothetical protein ACFE04_013817 [Oxalis oulophora]